MNNGTMGPCHEGSSWLNLVPGEHRQQGTYTLKVWLTNHFDNRFAEDLFKFYAFMGAKTVQEFQVKTMVDWDREHFDEDWLCRHARDWHPALWNSMKDTMERYEELTLEEERARRQKRSHAERAMASSTAA